MNRLSILTSAALCAVALLSGCAPKAPHADHVIILGFDAMSALGVQRAVTPNFNYMIENGAVSIHTRCVRETSSSQNWMSMVSASPIEMHTVFTNGWKPGDLHNVDPALHNNIGLYPTIFDHIRAQKPDYKQFAYIEWGGETRMYDMDAFDRVSVYKEDPDLKDAYDVMKKAFSEYMEERPEMLFVSMDRTDGDGHTFGHESEEYLNTVHKLDSLTGAFVRDLEAKGWLDNTVIIVTADHGGISFGHGGDTLAEYEIPIILFGGKVTKGKVMKHAAMIYDVGATAAALLGVELPFECHGKLLTEAFEPKDDAVYVPIPFVRPFTGRAHGDVSISVDDPDAKIYYTLDGSDPDENSILYEGPFAIDKSYQIRAVAIKDGCRSLETSNFLTPDGFEPAVAYKFYKNVLGNDFPDFTKFGLPYSTGYVDNFSLEEFDVAKEDHFAILMTSNFVVPEDANYKFELKSDDGAIIYLDGQVFISNPSAHSMKPAFGSIDLKAGKHVMKVEFFEISSVQNLIISYSINGGPLRPLMPTDLER